MLERDVRYIYPEYFDSRKPRGVRKVPLELAVPDPKIEEIALILRAANIPHSIEQKHHPANRYERKGRIAVKKLNVRKRKLLIAIAKSLKKLREKRK
jgi:signal recognition particle subunit SRP19